MKAEKSEVTVAVLSGGIGSERQVSLQSGKSVAEAIAEAGFRVISADIRPDMLDILDDNRINVFFPALHGQFGEDGRLQQILEDRGLLYVGSGPQASRIAFDKSAAKKAFANAGVATPREISVDSEKAGDGLEEKLTDFADKYVIKPITQGSSVGVTIVDEPDRAAAVARETFDRFGPCIIEPFVRGRELTVGILDGKALPIIEIRPTEGFYDYDAKYLDDSTQFVFDTIADAKLVSSIQAAAIECFDALGCRHFARADFILDDGGTAYALEVNTIPGFTSHSLLPKAASRAGMSMSDMCRRIVNMALVEGGYETHAELYGRNEK